MKSKEEIYNEATLKNLGNNPNGITMDIIYDAMESYSQEKMIDFLQWYKQLNPSDKVSVWSEDGNLKGLFNMSEKQMVGKYMKYSQK